MDDARIIRIQLTFLYLFLAIGGVFGNVILQAIGCIFILVLIITSKAENSLLYIMALIPNAAAFTISAIGSNFIGLSFLIVLLKILSKKTQWKPYLTLTFLLVSFYLLSFSLTRVAYGNFYDFALICQICIVVFAWICILKSLSKENAIQMIKFFRFGCVLMLFGMLIQYTFETAGIGRFRAVLDDCNYTGGVFSILMGICLLTFCFKLPLKNNYKYASLALVGGLMTGSRGFILACAVLFFILLISRSFGEKSSKIVGIVLLSFGVFYGLYLYGFGPAVVVYDNTIGRTINLNDSHQDGEFMDVTSGRTLLWAYYLDMALKDNIVLCFGKGFNNYFTIENGGYGLAAHNMFVSSIIGLGVIGTAFVLILYFSIVRIGTRLINNRTGFAFCSLVIAIITCYFFLDGILETRFVTYFAISVILIKIFIFNKPVKEHTR